MKLVIGMKWSMSVNTDTNLNEKVIFALRDDKVGACPHQFFDVNNATAIRGFESACMDPNSDFFKHPEDYSLWRVGRFDTVEMVVAYEPAVCLARAIDFKDDPTVLHKSGEPLQNLGVIG